MTATIKTLPHYFPEVFAQRVILSVLILVALCAIILLLYKKKKIDKFQRNIAFVLSFYVVVLLYFTVIGRYSHDEYEYRIHFYYSYKRLIEHFEWQNIRTFVINIAMLVPVGFFVPMLINSKGKYWKTIVIALLFIIVIEVLQMLTKTGTFEVDDIINNLLGVALGMLLYRITLQLYHKNRLSKGNNYE